MNTINLQQVMTGRDYPAAGIAFYDALIPFITEGQEVIVDVKGVDLLPSMFLTMSIGRIIKEKGLDALKPIKFINIPKSQIANLTQYVSRITSAAMS